MSRLESGITTKVIVEYEPDGKLIYILFWQQPELAMPTANEKL
ncbi:hypothetical protein SPSIL_005310 [Sporomusa silvacetica DSM 10669]|uniref:DUF2283 domain-containing protein n=1 Tax=Sporomusa silvacetica DSM 10669 TaxID=1123289 RepID=A0ABZ3IFG3_9FIRM|nr:hypothetical protein SPSIL_35090 [Sporomusa silvacetica DSM 10669]